MYTITNDIIEALHKMKKVRTTLMFSLVYRSNQ
jgi:hypothetical protein